MITNERTVCTQIVSSNDGLHTYEIRRIWDESKRHGIVIELYPTISLEDCSKTDLSTMHLMNHVNEFAWGSVTIINLYSTVFISKPSTKELLEDDENLEYMKALFSQSDIKDADICISWGSGLSNHMPTIRKKIEILELLNKKKLSKQVKCIVPEDPYDITNQGVHPLFLGLHHAKERWGLEEYDIAANITELKTSLAKTPSKAKVKKSKEKQNDENKIAVFGKD